MSTSLKPLGLAVALVLAGCNQAVVPADAANAADMADAAAVQTMADAAPAPAADAAAVPAPQLQAAMRDLWHGHIVHTRDYALAVHAGNDDDAKAAADAVVANARQISDAVSGFYGEAGGEQMMTLLAGHRGAVKAPTETRAAQDGDGATRALDALNANAAPAAKLHA